MNIVALATHPHASDTLVEAERLMTVCNSCRYCEGICAVFPAMEMRRAFSDGDLNYLANLCHGCGACFADCQFAPPHEFNVNVPKTLATLRGDSYRHYAWPRPLGIIFERNGVWISLITALAVAVFIAGFVARNGRDVLFASHAEPGAFYRLMPHTAMAGLFMAISVFVLLAAAMSLRRFWTDIGPVVTQATAPASTWQALKDILTLRYLDGGGAGCMNDESEAPTDQRRLFHHLTFYGFALCYAATSVATLYHYLLGLEAPYPWYDLPVLLGSVGGIGLLIGPAGLLYAKWTRDPRLSDAPRTGMDVAFILMLFLTSLTGLLLLAFRETGAMGILLSIHLGIVFSLILTVPYSKFMHGLYRAVALLKYAQERRNALGK